jgi:hypothetical protein
MLRRASRVTRCCSTQLRSAPERHEDGPQSLRCRSRRRGVQGAERSWDVQRRRVASQADTGAMDENLKRLPSKDTRETLRLASTEAEQAMLLLVGICRPELFPADEWNTLRRVNRELEDVSTTLYAMAVRGTKEARERD